MKRVMTWARWIGSIFALLLGLLFAFLTVAGISSYRDFKGLVERAENELQPKLQQAVTSAQDAEVKARQAQEKANSAAAQAGAALETIQKVKGLEKEYISVKTRMNGLSQRVTEAETFSANISGQVGALAASLKVDIPLISSISTVPGMGPSYPQAIMGSNFGSTFGHVYLRVTNARTNQGIIPEMEVGRQFISVWNDTLIKVRVPDMVLEKIEQLKQRASEAAKKSGGTTLGVKYEYQIQSASGKKSNWAAHVDWGIYIEELPTGPVTGKQGEPGDRRNISPLKRQERGGWPIFAVPQRISGCPELAERGTATLSHSSQNRA